MASNLDRIPVPELVFAVLEDGGEFLLDAAREGMPTHVDGKRVTAVRPGPDLSHMDENDAKVEARNRLEAFRTPKAQASETASVF